MSDVTGSDDNPPARIYRLMTSNTEAVEAVEQLVHAAQRELRIFDATPRALRDRGFGSPSRIETLRRLLLADRSHLLRVALHDVRAIETELPRLVDLLTRFSGQIQIHRTIDQATEARDPMIVADACHYWRKLHVDQPRSVITLHDATDTKPILDRFEEIWERSEVAVTGSTIGL